MPAGLLPLLVLGSDQAQSGKDCGYLGDWFNESRNPKCCNNGKNGGNAAKGSLPVRFSVKYELAHFRKFLIADRHPRTPAIRPTVIEASLSHISMSARLMAALAKAIIDPMNG